MKRLMCVVDLEATCWPDRKVPGPGGQGWIEPRNEIIEIGAAMVELPELSALGEFDMFVHPKLNSVLTDFCKTLTSIRQEDVNAALLFPAVLEKFEAWTSTFGLKEDVLFGSWGMYDKNQLLRDCELHGAPFPFDDEHLNIKNHVAARLGRRPKGVGRTLAALGMAFEGTPHRGIDDVRNILRIVRKVGPGELPAVTAGKCGQDGEPE
ncbi:MAG: hypothetical protein A3J70_12815 [Elusimicrobia bacterium RIFCSPHIGHO2_02_FULL_61_10]|nr:MAG: hypothetical protein A3J70_12815 [Elusimicrobia bacterium RIFCSPHIGHO2_02_FULL_61_10]